MNIRRIIGVSIAMAAATLSASCINGGSNEGNPLLPGPANLVMTFTPSPVAPTRDEYCGFTFYEKGWYFTMFIQNTGTEPFVVSSWARLRSETGSFLAAETFVNPTELSWFSDAYGTTTIPARQTIQAKLCLAPNFPSTYARYRLANAQGVSFESPTLRLAP